MITFHTTFAWIAIALCGLTGLFGLGLAVLRRTPGRPFWAAVGTSIVAVLLQVGAGFLVLPRPDARAPGGFHMFYGFVILFTLSFAYIYRIQLQKRPALAWGLLMLFIMGLGFRGIASFGRGV
jgi:hypothetical protein